MRHLILSFVLLALPAALPADELDRPIREATELRDWCRTASEAALVGQGLSPSNWTARYWNDAETLNVDGQWHAGDQRWRAQCRIARGAPARLATVSVSPAVN